MNFLKTELLGGFFTVICSFDLRGDVSSLATELSQLSTMLW